MNITISNRAKSSHCLLNNRHISTQSKQPEPSQWQKPVSKTQTHCQDSHRESPHLAKWLMGKCFSKSNSILEEQAARQNLAHHKLQIHSLSSKRARQDTVSSQQIESPTLSSTLSCSLSKGKHVKIKLETGKEGTKTTRILRLKTCQAKLNPAAQPGSCSSTSRAFQQKLNDKIVKAMQKERQQPISLVHLEKSGNELLGKHIWKMENEQKHRIQDCIYEPIFIVGQQKSQPTTPKDTKNDEINGAINSPSEICSDESLVLTRGLNEIFQIYAKDSPCAEQKIGASQQHSASGLRMFVIYEKNDEALQYQ